MFGIKIGRGLIYRSFPAYRDGETITMVGWALGFGRPYRGRCI